MTFLGIIIFFILPANLLLLALVCFGVIKKIGRVATFFSSFGIAPFLNSIVYYYLIWFFPGRDDAFYLMWLVVFWLIVLIISFSAKEKLVSLYKTLFFDSAFRIRKYSSDKMLVFFAVLLFAFFIVYFLQSFVYPVISNDSSLYLMQSQAIAKYKNLDWQLLNPVLIDGGEYKYNTSIRPGIPTLVSLFLTAGFDYRLLFQFISAYYYVLLFISFLFFVRLVASDLKKNVSRSLFFAALFFVFSWAITRSFIFNAKEPAVYFFALLVLFFTYVLSKKSTRETGLEIMLSMAIGIGMLINLHGVIIGIIAACILFLFSQLGLKARLGQVLTIFLLQLIFCAFDFFRVFLFVFAITAKSLYKSASDFLSQKSNIALAFDSISQKSDIATLKKFESSLPSNHSLLLPNAQGLASQAHDQHLALYAMQSTLDMYMKGKLQILTKIGIFGTYFWFFLGTILMRGRELLNSRLTKTLLTFMLMYFVLVLDIFGINKHPTAVVLWGSTKYSSLMLLLGMIVVSVYADEFFYFLADLTEKYRTKIITLVMAMLSAAILFKDDLLSFGVKLLFMTTPFLKEESFYYDKIKFFYYSLMIFLAAFSSALIFLRHKKNFTRKIIISFLLAVCVGLPFFITNVGKVPLIDTFRYLNDDMRTKLENSSSGDIYRVYFYAIENISKGSLIRTPYNEIYEYDDYFSRLNNSDPNAQYEISEKCGKNVEVLFSFGKIKLCKL